MTIDKNTECLAELLGTIFECVEHYLIYKSIMKNKDRMNRNDTRSFLILSANAHIELFYIEWCKIFTEHKGKIHFTNEIMESQLHNGLLNEYKVEASKFEDYKTKARQFRNRYVAHSEKFEDVVPHTDIAIYALIVLNQLLEHKYPNDEIDSIKDYICANKNKYDEVVEGICFFE